jgi:hypothetical protein
MKSRPKKAQRDGEKNGFPSIHGAIGSKEYADPEKVRRENRTSEEKKSRRQS